MTGHGGKVAHDDTGMLLRIKTLALTHGALTFAGDQIGQATHKVILLFCKANKLWVGVCIMPGRGSGMDFQLVKSTSGGEFRAQGIIQHKTHEGPVTDLHSELFPGDDGLDSGLSSIEGMTCSFVYMVS